MKLIERIESLRAREHDATVALIKALLELERTQDHITLGYSGMWDFLVRHLKYSNAAASRRTKAVKCARKFPRVLEMLHKHETNLSALAAAEATLSRATDPQELLGQIRGKSQAQVERTLARHNPTPRKRETVRRVAVRPRPAAKCAPDMFTATSAAEVEDRVQLSFTVTAPTYDKLEQAKAILSRKYPMGLTLEQTLGELLDAFLRQPTPRPRKARPKNAQSGDPEPGKTTAGKAAPNRTTRHIPTATRREVFARDRHRCTYTGPSGTRCQSTHDLELDHIRPWALGGDHDAANLRVLCAKHNRHRNREVREGTVAERLPSAAVASGDGASSTP